MSCTFSLHHQTGIWMFRGRHGRNVDREESKKLRTISRFCDEFIIYRRSHNLTFNFGSWLITLHFVSWNDIFLLFPRISKYAARVHLTATNWNYSRTKSAELHSQLTINHFFFSLLNIFTSFFSLSRFFCTYDNSLKITINLNYSYVGGSWSGIAKFNFSYRVCGAIKFDCGFAVCFGVNFKVLLFVLIRINF